MSKQLNVNISDEAWSEFDQAISDEFEGDTYGKKGEVVEKLVVGWARGKNTTGKEVTNSDLLEEIKGLRGEIRDPTPTSERREKKISSTDEQSTDDEGEASRADTRDTNEGESEESASDESSSSDAAVKQSSSDGLGWYDPDEFDGELSKEELEKVPDMGDDFRLNPAHIGNKTPRAGAWQYIPIALAVMRYTGEGWRYSDIEGFFENEYGLGEKTIEDNKLQKKLADAAVEHPFEESTSKRSRHWVAPQVHDEIVQERVQYLQRRVSDRCANLRTMEDVEEPFKKYTNGWVSDIDGEYSPSFQEMRDEIEELDEEYEVVDVDLDDLDMRIEEAKQVAHERIGDEDGVENEEDSESVDSESDGGADESDDSSSSKSSGRKPGKLDVKDVFDSKVVDEVVGVSPFASMRSLRDDERKELESLQDSRCENDDPSLVMNKYRDLVAGAVDGVSKFMHMSDLDAKTVEALDEAESELDW